MGVAQDVAVACIRVKIEGYMLVPNEQAHHCDPTIGTSHMPEELKS